MLIVDDDASKRVALKGMIAASGYEIVEADSGMAAVSCVEERNFAVILLDVRMPVMDGYTTASLIRKRKNSEVTPIIFVTAHDRDLVAEAGGFALGETDFIHAPIDPAEVRSKVGVFASPANQAGTPAVAIRSLQPVTGEILGLPDAAPHVLDAGNFHRNAGWADRLTDQTCAHPRTT